MAEIVGLASAIIAIAGAADTALRMAKSMRRLSRDLGAARKDVRMFSKEIKAFSSIIGAAHYSLKTHSRKSQSQSKVLVFIHERKLLDQLVDQSDHVIDRIEEIWPHIELLRSRISLITRLKWVLCRTDITALRSKMESVKISLNLVITLITFETLMQSLNNGVGPGESTKLVACEIRRLRRDMDMLLEQMVDLQHQQELSPWQNLEDSANTFVTVQMDIQAALADLRSTIANRDIISNVERSSTSSQTLGTNHDHYAVPDSNVPSRTLPVSPSRHLRHRRSPIRSQTQRRTVERSPPIADTEIVPYEDADQGLEGSESAKSGSLDLRQVPTETMDPRERPSALSVEDHPESPPSISRPAAEGDFTFVQAINPHLKFNSSLSSGVSRINGYVKTNNGLESVTALLDTKLSKNIISRAYAQELGLEIQPSDEAQEPFWIQVDNLQERKSTGSILVEWTQGDFLDDKAFRVQCLVHDPDEVETIVFGSSFLKRRKHYLQSDDIATDTNEDR